MNILTRFRHQLFWLNVPSTLLIALLQRTPALRLIGVAEEMLVSSPLGNVLRSIFVGTVSLGVLDTMAGATQYTASTPSPLGATVGTPVTNVAFGTIGTVDGSDPDSWNLSGNMPPGLNISGRTAGTVSGSSLLLQGTPTTAGTYTITLLAHSAEWGDLSFSFDYTITVTGGGGGNTAPSITLQPNPQTVNVGANVTFTSGADGTPAPTVRWQKDNVDVPGATSTTLTLNNVQTTDGGTYKMIATNTVSSATSNGALLTVNVGNTAPVITLNPVPQSVTIGTNVTFTAGASGSPAPTYRWQKDSVDIPGATSTTLSLNNVQLSDGGTYKMIATNVVSSATTTDAVLTVTTAAPAISLQPTNQTVATTTTATFTAAATGSPTPTLQWQRLPAGSGTWADISNGGSYSGATTGSLAVSGSTIGMSGDQFRLVATNIISSATSSAALLTVFVPQPPSISVQPTPQSVNEGGNTSFTITATSNYTISYAWQVFPAGGSSWSNLSDTGGYSGSATATLSLTGVSSLLTGNSYRCVATNSVGSTNSNGALLTVITPPAMMSVAAGRYHSLRLNNSAFLYATGANDFGQLGTGNTTTTNSPVLVSFPGGRVMARVAAGGQHSLLLTTAGELWATGSNSNGQLGDGTIVSKSTPFQVTSNVVALAAGLLHSAFLKNDGTLWTVGSNAYGQLGNGTQTDAHSPIQIANNVVDLSAGFSETLFVKADGTLWAMGDLYSNGTLVLTPIQIATGVQTAAAGGCHSLFLKTDGTVWAFGFGLFGELGTGGTATLTTPVQIATSVSAIGVGYFHSFFIKTDNSLWVFGYNSQGQLGDGTTTPRLTPYQLATNVASASASESYTLFTKNDGSLWGSGLNGNGQFGSGNTTTVSSPILISGGASAAPGIPAGVSALPNAGFTGLELAWTPAADAPGYDVWRGTVNNFSSATRIAQNLRWAFYLDVSVSGGTTYYYWITATNSAGTSSPSTVVSSTLNPPVAPGFSTQPSPQSVTSGSPATFTVAVTGSPTPTLQWQRFLAGGSVWADLSNAGNYAGVTTTSLTVSATIVGMSGDQFRCVATNVVTSSNSNAVSLTVTSSMAAANDFNADGKSDIIWQNTTTGVRGFWLMNGTGYSSWVSLSQISTDWRIAGTADFNADGKTDLLWENTVTGDRGFWLMNGTTYSSWVSMGYVSIDWRIAAVADFNGDGKPDILWENTTTGVRGFWVMDGTNYVSWVYLNTVSTDWRIAAAADFNNDGNPDIVWENTVNGDRGFWLMNGMAYSSWVDLGVVATQWRIAATADFSGDGKPDFLWENTATGDRGLWIMNGTAYSSWVSLGFVSTDWQFAN